MQKIKQFLFLTFVSVIMLLILISNWSNLKDGFKKPELIISKVTLKNECSITSDAFVVVHQKTKKESSTFQTIFQESNFMKMT